MDSARFLDSLGVKIFKTASADIVDLPLHQFLAGTGKTVIISTGMASMSEIEEALDLYKAAGNSNLILLHCVSNYPCKFESLNLRVIQSLKTEFGFPVGYSDHALGVYPATAAVAMGAKVIEKHFTLDKNLKGPDHKASSTPEEFKDLVDGIRICETALGSPIKSVQDEEKEMRLISRKSIFLSKAVLKGSQIRPEDLVLKRPGTGLYARYFPSLVGKLAQTDLEAGHMLSIDDVE